MLDRITDFTSRLRRDERDAAGRLLVFVFGIFRPSLWFEYLIGKVTPRKYWYADFLVLLVPITGIFYFGWDTYIVLIFVLYEFCVGLIISMLLYFRMGVSREFKWIFGYLALWFILVCFGMVVPFFLPDWALFDPSLPTYESSVSQSGNTTSRALIPNFDNINSTAVWQAVWDGWIFLIYIPLFELLHMPKITIDEKGVRQVTFWIQFAALVIFFLVCNILGWTYEEEQAFIRYVVFWVGIVFLSIIIVVRSLLSEE